MLRPLSVLVACLGAVLAAPGDMYVAVPTDQTDWNFCGLDYTAQCPPTIPIEQSACEAPLVLNGVVLQVVIGSTPEDIAVQIQVDFLSYVCGSTSRKTVQKWGAGLQNDKPSSPFYNSSGLFTTWITQGFNNTPTAVAPNGYDTTPCSTRSPQLQQNFFFFLQSLPENAGKTVAFVPDGSGALNVNFSLSTTMLQSGLVPDTPENYDLVAQGAFGENQNLTGSCEAIYCCYNKGCAKCSSVLSAVKSSFSCHSTLAPSGGPSMTRGALADFLMIVLSAAAIVALFA